MKRKVSAIVCGVIIAAMMLSFTASAAEKFDLKFSIAGSSTIRMSKIWNEWAEKVTEATDGNVTFTFYYDSTLLDANSAYQQLLSGVADIGDVHCFEDDGFIVAEKWKGLTLGTPIPAQTEMSKQLFSEFEELQNEYKDVHYLAMGFDGGSYQLLTVNKEVHSVDDMKGLVIWCEAGFNDFFKALGATPVNTPWAEVYSSLQKNMYDGLFIAAETLESVNFAEVCKYVTMVNLNYLAGPGHMMNLNTYNKLPDEYKAVIDDPELQAWVEGQLFESSHSSEAEGIQWAVENRGTKVIEISDEEHQKFVDVLNESKAGMVEELDKKGVPGTEILNRIVELSAEYSSAPETEAE